MSAIDSTTILNMLKSQLYYNEKTKKDIQYILNNLEEDSRQLSSDITQLQNHIDFQKNYKRCRNNSIAATFKHNTVYNTVD